MPDRSSCSENANKTRRSFFATQFRFKYGLVLIVKKIYPRDPSAYFELCKKSSLTLQQFQREPNVIRARSI